MIDYVIIGLFAALCWVVYLFGFFFCVEKEIFFVDFSTALNYMCIITILFWETRPLKCLFKVFCFPLRRNSRSMPAPALTFLVEFMYVRSLETEFLKAK